MFYMVYGLTKVQQEPVYVGRGRGVGGADFVQAPEANMWHPIGVFSAATAESACRAAAKKQRAFGSFFAIEGFPWGIDVMPDEDVKEFGSDDVTEMTSLEKAENKSREMELEAGL